MTLTGTAVLFTWYHERIDDAVEEILDSVGDVSGLELWRSQCLIADYVRPTLTRSGLITPVNAQAEDVYQSKSGMLLAYGPLAFPDYVVDENGKVTENDFSEFGGRKPQIGDWLGYRPTETVQLMVKAKGAKENGREWKHGWPCRYVYARDLYLRVPLPYYVV